MALLPARLLLFILSLAAWAPAGVWAGQPSPLVLDPERPSLLLAPHVSILDDPQGQLSLAEAASPALAGRYQPCQSLSLSLGLHKGAAWLRFYLDTPPETGISPGYGKIWLLELGKPIIDQVDLYLPRPGPAGGWVHLAAGTERPRPPQQVEGRNLVLRLPDQLPANQPIYLRLQSSISLSMPLRLWSGAGVARHYFRENLALGLIFGVMAAMVIFNLVLFFSLRDRAYLYYVFYVFSMLLGQAVLQGVVGGLLDMPQPHLARVQAFLLGASMFLAALFTRTFLLTRVNAPFWDRLLNFFLAAPLLMMALVLAGRLDLANPLGYGIAALGPVHAICTAVACLRRGFKPALFFLMAWSVLIVSVFAFELTSLGLLPPSTLSGLALPLGAALESVLLTFGLTNRLRLLEQERRRLARSERRYQELSLTDSLTGLYNVRYMNKKLMGDLESGRLLEQPLALIMLDLDDFKTYNDTYGHPEGDKVLQGLARVIKATVREVDSPCRYGGEEFAVILPGTSLEGALQVAERIRQRLAARDFQPRMQIKVGVTVSLGVAQHQPSESAEELLRRADQALYQAKARGKNCCVAAEA